MVNTQSSNPAATTLEMAEKEIALNLTISQINNSWQRFKVKYIAAACGIAIAAGALVAIAPWESNQSSGAPIFGREETQVGTFADAAEASMFVSEGVASVTLQSSSFADAAEASMFVSEGVAGVTLQSSSTSEQARR